MGAVPKRKISKGRKNRRRSQDLLKKPATSICPKCKQPKRPHFKCPNCGHYGKLESTKKSDKSATKKK
ncbi:50S ribosomal protein L32 [Candidatus Dojkabacteria bacterium]|nr:50S ribosomal protein L32 [Candidatus Dojkabacteria bacterium]